MVVNWILSIKTFINDWGQARIMSENKWITVKGSSIHNKGIFAKTDIPKGTKIIEYVGEIISNKEADKRADRDDKNGTVYLFELDKKRTIDGDVDYNTAKYINHTCDPNCETEEDDGHIWIIAMRDIKKGEELSYDYGFDYDVGIEHPCKCGTENCRLYIVAEDQHKKMIKHLAKLPKKISS